MRLPIAILLFIAVCLAVAPWRRSDPRHEFIFDQLRTLSEPEPDSETESPAPAEELSGYRSAVGHHHSAGRSNV